MKSCFAAALAAAIITLLPRPVLAQPSYVDCVVAGVGCTTALQGSGTSYTFVIAAGYRTPGDGGGGEFYSSGVGSCSPQTTGTTHNSSPVITNVISTAGVWATVGTRHGVPISGSGIPSSSDVTSVSSSSDTITISANATATGSTTLTFSNSDNGGTIIQDGNHYCYYRTNYRGDPHEWGAYGNANANGTLGNDTAALNAWLGWTPGPWNALIPSNYDVTGPLTCPSDTTVLGPANQVASSNPPVRIFAGSGFTGGSALLVAQDFCRVSGITLDANNQSSYGVDVQGNRVVIDGFSAVENATQYNVNCGSTQVSGLEIKDSQIKGATSDNIYMPANCANVRLIGDVITGAGGNGVTFGGEDLTVADGIIESSQGVGLLLADTAHMIQVTGMSFQQNGKGSAHGQAIQIGDASGGASWVTICGNHFYESGYNNSSLTTTSHILFVNGSYLNLCGNVYRADSTYGPAYAYDAASATVSLPNTGIYESAQPQNVGTFTANAAAVLPMSQVAPSSRTFITGLGLSNGTSSNTRIVIALGNATDSTGVAVISIPSGGCTVNISNEYLGGLDSVSYPKLPSTTYFFFVVADETGANSATSPNCMASINPYPNFTGTGYGAGIYRLVGVLYTDSSTHMVQFQQEGDTFYLDTPVADVNGMSIGASATSVSLGSVPTGISVEALGRCVASATTAPTPYVLMFTPPPTGTISLTPANFPTVPGYAMKAQASAGPTTGLTSFPYRLYTDTATDIKAQASGSVTLNCMTDGWVWHRQQ